MRKLFSCSLRRLSHNLDTSSTSSAEALNFGRSTEESPCVRSGFCRSVEAEKIVKDE
uniref:Uncharacterized protein n=1 Tax=Anguilla anguilla TaxID=7936 RepID=A0A0E9TAP3_ANGAN